MASMPASFSAIPGFPTVQDAVVNDLNAAGIRSGCARWSARRFMRPGRTKKLPPVFMAASGNSGNAASRVESFIYSKGAYANGGYPDIDDLFLKQAAASATPRNARRYCSTSSA
jgi:hypothetical protein